MANAGDVREVVHITVGQPARLRDYFLRLGADSTVVDGGRVRVELTDDGGHEHTVGDYLRHWVERNGIEAAIEPTTAPVAPITIAPFFNERPRLGDLLLAKGLVTQDQLADALTDSRATGELLGRVLIQRGAVFEDELARTLAEQLDLPYVNIRVTGFDRGVARMMPVEEGLRVAAIPIGFRGGRLRVAFADPSDKTAQEVVERHTGPFEVAVADFSDIDIAWRSVGHVTAGAGVW
jgi:hypothetical protein